MIRILKKDADIHDGLVTAYRRKPHRRMSYPQCIWNVEKDGVIIAWANELAFTADIEFHAGIRPAVSGHVTSLTTTLHNAAWIPPHRIRATRLMPRTVMLTSDGELWCPAVIPR